MYYPQKKHQPDDPDTPPARSQPSVHKITTNSTRRIAKTATHGTLKAQRPYSIGQGPSALSPKGAPRHPEG
ncbi:MAG: hypothetical protein PUD30_05720 [Muribaculaceae bacterium]|nr:hypothetical protein [Muribaculaceae bacterium]